MGRQPRDSKKRKRLLRYLFNKHGGKCTRCKCEVLIAADSLASGLWVWYLTSRYLRYHNTMEIVPIATLDHVIPLSRGGTWRIENLTILCGKCNYTKGNRLTGEGQRE